MNLSNEQRELVASWVAGGAALAEIQRRLKDECGLALTYMDVRFVVDDLKLQLKEEPRETAAAERLAAAKEEGEGERAAAEHTGGVRVTMDQITKPHALASGQVTFSDGQTAAWMLDEMGRLALNPSTPGYRPGQSDIMAFQQELQRVAQGF